MDQSDVKKQKGMIRPAASVMWEYPDSSGRMAAETVLARDSMNDRPPALNAAVERRNAA